MKGTHTQGPWRDGGAIGSGRMIFGGTKRNPSPIAVAYGAYCNPDSEANVRLIVAAPKLLEALKLARKCIAYCRKNHTDAQKDEGVPVELFIDEAIAEAEGGAE